MDRHEEEDSRKELIIDGHEKSLSGAQDELKVKSSNSSCDFHKTIFQSLQKFDFQPIVDSIEKSKNVFKYAGKFVRKKECSNKIHSSFYSHDRHNTCTISHNAYLHTICNYCGKSGHISHTCYFRRNSNMRNKYIWVPKRHVRVNTNNQGPKYMWVPKCPSSTSCMQDDPKRNGHKGTEKIKKPRGSHVPIKRFMSSQKRTLRTSIVGATEHNHRKKQWIKGGYFTSRKGYHNVPFIYLEENMKRRISHSQRKRLSKPTSHEKALHNPKAKYTKTELQRKMQWVCRSNPPST